jgi:hypothetical protein
MDPLFQEHVELGQWKGRQCNEYQWLTFFVWIVALVKLFTLDNLRKSNVVVVE